MHYDRALHGLRQHPGGLRHGRAASAPPARPGSSGTSPPARSSSRSCGRPARARDGTTPRRLSNVVFMGMGEPFANYDRTWAAIRPHPRRPRPLRPAPHASPPSASSRASAGWPPRTSRSTSPSRSTRPTTGSATSWFPINRRYPLADAHRRLRRLPARPRTAGSRSSGPSSTAPTTGAPTPRSWPPLARPLRAHVNLIPLNATPGWPTKRLTARPGRRLPRPAQRARGQRHRAGQPGHRHRRRVRTAPGQPRGHASAPPGAGPDGEPVRRPGSHRPAPPPSTHPGAGPQHRVPHPPLDDRAVAHHRALDDRSGARRGRPSGGTAVPDDSDARFASR